MGEEGGVMGALCMLCMDYIWRTVILALSRWLKMVGEPFPKTVSAYWSVSLCSFYFFIVKSKCRA